MLVVDVPLGAMTLILKGIWVERMSPEWVLHLSQSVGVEMPRAPDSVYLACRNQDGSINVMAVTPDLEVAGYTTRPDDGGRPAVGRN